jgi:hypothetical protein
MSVHFTKVEIVNYCIAQLDIKYHQLHSALTQIQEAIANETKSTAGDKHETAKAILQTEQEKIGKQIQLCQYQKQELVALQAHPSKHINATKGALIETNHGFIFIGGGLGKLVLNKLSFISISVQSPLALKLNGCKIDDSISLNEKTYQILNIL